MIKLLVSDKSILYVGASYTLEGKNYVCKNPDMVINIESFPNIYEASAESLPADFNVGKYGFDNNAFFLKSVPPELLKTMRAQKMLDIYNWRDRMNTSTFPHIGHRIKCDRLARSDIEATEGYIALYDEYHPMFPRAWETADGVIIPMPDPADFKAMYGSMVTQGLILYGMSRQFEALAAIAQNQAELDAIILPDQV
jgi:hypothetical protein